jgi:hypothetical protein
MVSVELTAAKSLAGNIFLPITVGSSSHETAKNIAAERKASRKVFERLSEKYLCGEVKL